MNLSSMAARVNRGFGRRAGQVLLAVAVFLTTTAFGLSPADSPTSTSSKLHDPPPVFPEMILEADHASYRVLMWAQIYHATFGFAREDIESGPAAEAKRRGEVLCNWIHQHAPVWIDGQLVRPTLNELSTHKNDVHNVVITFRYSTPSPPKKIRYRWTDFVFDKDFFIPEIRTFFTCEEDFLVNTFTPDEKEFTWHRPIPSIEVVALDVISDRLRLPRPSTIPLPLASTAIILLAAMVLGFGRLLSLSFRARMFLLVASLGMAFAARDIAVWDLEVGQDVGEQRISENDAKELFRSLHANVYRAFDYEQESAVYDTLAESVSAELLDRLYNEIYRSLVMREAGGAVAAIKAVKIFSAEVSYPGDSDEQQFDVNCDWQVKGVVEHLGHKHLRTQRYHARYRVMRRDDKWRIADVEILSQERIDDDQ